MAMTMTIPNNPSAKRITVQIPTSSGDAIEAWGPRAAAGGECGQILIYCQCLKLAR
jgi:hypothetical protein